MKRFAIWAVIGAAWLWLIIDGGMGRVMAIVGLAAIAVGGIAVYIANWKSRT